MPDAARVIIAQVMDAHGIKGQIKLRPLTDFPERFLSMKELRLYRQGAPVGTYGITEIREVPAQGCLFAALSGVRDRDQAEALRGCTVEISKDERVPLKDGEYWISDLIGLNASDDQGNELGFVKDILDTGASDLMEIVDPEGKIHLIPLVRDFFVGADLEKRQVIIHLIDGLWSV